MTDLDQALASSARALRQSAQSHKRMERWHRERLREEMDALAKLEAVCKAHGIALVLETIDGEVEVTHGREVKSG